MQEDVHGMVETYKWIFAIGLSLSGMLGLMFGWTMPRTRGIRVDVRDKSLDWKDFVTPKKR